jgi:O-antigen/teichoic acid export membrane protein
MSELKSLAKNTSLLAGTRVVQFLAGLFKVKIIASILDTTGVGIFDQLNFLNNKLAQFTTVGTVEGFIKQLVQIKNEGNSKKAMQSAFKSYTLVILAFLIISFIFLIIFPDYLNNKIFGENANKLYYVITLITFPILILISYPFSILKALTDFKGLSQARIIIVLLQLIITVPIIYKYKLLGAAVTVFISTLIELIVNYSFAKKYFEKYDITFSSIWNAPLVPVFLKEIYLFSGFGLIIGTYQIVSEFICRSIVANKLGVSAIGIYSPVILIASIFTGFILPSLSNYLYPRFCEVKSNSEIVSILNDAIRLFSIILVPFMFIIIPYRELFISLIYSKNFFECEKYMPFHLIGNVFYIWFYILAQYLSPQGKIKIHGIFMIFYFTLDIIVTFLLVTNFGLYSWMLKHIISPFVFFFVYLIYSYLDIGFILKIGNIILMLYIILGSIFLFAIQKYYIHNYFIISLIVLLTLCCSYFLLKTNEKQYIANKIESIKYK